MIREDIPAMGSEAKRSPASGVAQSARWAGLASSGLNLRAAERQLLLAVVDIVLLNGALVVAVRWLSRMLDSPGATLGYWFWFVTLTMLWWLVAQLFECYDLARAASGPHSMINASAAALLTVVVYQWIPRFSPPLGSRGMVLAFGVLSVASIALWRGFYSILFRQPTFEQKALVMGAGWAGRALVHALESLPQTGNPFHGTGFRVLGFLDDDDEKRQSGDWAGLPVVGSSRDLGRLARELGVDEVVVAITQHHTISAEAFAAIMAARENGIRVSTMPAVYERLLGRVPVEHVGQDLGAVLPQYGSPTERVYWAAKRVLDIVLGVVGSMALLLLAPPVALADAVFAPGPLFYRQTRVGKGGRSFRVIKFRTMRPDAENGTGAVWSPAGDERITPVGRWLRKSRLDELPQVLNVLRGDMSLIGPRPERPEFVDTLAFELPFYRARHAVRPGITGWAQVRFGYGNTVQDACTKLEYDLYYVRHAGFYLDGLILLKTVAVVLKLKGK